MNEQLGLTICYLVNENGEKDFYVVHDGKIQYRFQRVEIDGRIFFVVPCSENMKEREGFIFKKVTVQENEYDGWVYENPAMNHYFQLYLMNEKGEKSFYDYETTENQLQKYTEMTKEKEPLNIFIVTTIVFAVTTVALLGYIMMNKKRR